MPSNFLKSSILQETVLQALGRMLTVAPTVWRDAGGSFRGAAGDTVTLRVPAYTVANDRALRSGSARTRRGLFETPVPVTLDHNLYRDVPLSDEEQTLDIREFGRQVINPMLTGIARGIEDVLLEDAMLDADYEYEVDFGDHSSGYEAIVMARKHLNDARVPSSQRYLACGTTIAAELLGLPQFARVDQSGTSQSLREGVLGRISGFEVMESPGLPPDEAYAYHQTAYALSTQAPLVPAGAPAGFTGTADSFAIRLVQVLDATTIENIVAADVFVGASPVNDRGEVDGNGVFTPAEVPDLANNEDIVFVRGVKITSGSGSA